MVSERLTQDVEVPKSVWEAIFFSYYLSQGSSYQQKHILTWLVFKNPEAFPENLTEDEKGSISKQISEKIWRYAEAARESGKHKKFSSSEQKQNETSNPEYYVTFLFNALDTFKSRGNHRLVLVRERKKFLKDIAMWMLSADKAVMFGDDNRKKGRAIDGKKRDEYASFFIDLALLKKDTGLFPWSSLPNDFKALLKDLVEYLKVEKHNDERFRELTEKVVQGYIEHHPNLSEEKRKIIDDFVAPLTFV